MKGKWRPTISVVSALAILLGWGSAQLTAQEIDLQYRCVILKTKSTDNQTTLLPTSDAQLSVGDTFFVEFWATDSGTANAGLVSVFADLDYPQNLVSDCVPVHTSLFNLVFSESICDGLIVDELGGLQFAGGVGSEPEWARVAYVQFTASASGVANFILEPATSESATFNGGAISPLNIDYGNCSVTIVTAIEETGACCDSSDRCSENMTEADCLLFNGRYLGNNIACGDDPDGDSLIGCSDICPASSAPMGVDFEGRPLGDFDEDCDVDINDFWIFQGNFSGTGN